MKIFSSDYLNNLTVEAKANPRKRQHRNIHESFEEKCQRLFNAIEPDSYIRPHRHSTDPKDELLIALRGSMALVTFNQEGFVTEIITFGACKNGEGLAVGVEVSPNTWHTVIALEAGSILFEVKAGSFNPSQPKDLAPWAPNEHDPNAKQYLETLRSRINR